MPQWHFVSGLQEFYISSLETESLVDAGSRSSDLVVIPQEDNANEGAA